MKEQGHTCSIKFWYQRMVDKSFGDSEMLKGHVESMGFTENFVEQHQCCALNMARRRPVLRDCVARAQEPKDIVHSYALSQALGL